MLQHRLREPVSVLINPISRGLIKVGIKADYLTVLGAIGVSAAALYFYGRGEFILGTVIVTLFALLDLLDGTVARLSNATTSKWGALLDSTLDRISDAMIVIGIFIYLDAQGDPISYLPIAVMVLSGLVSYIRARAESLGIECSVGLGERTERLMVILLGAFLYGLGISSALDISLWITFFMSVVTIAQRLIVVFRA